MTFSDDLLRWYDGHRREFPWRGTCDPYRIWLSEIMLQQTQTETVKRYYARFLNRFPTVFDLADASEDEVLKLWEGLGYYSRARNLHAAARKVAREMGGVFPDSAAGLRRLPGIGPYAANAIASIAYGECAPALDGNQARVLSRVLAHAPVIKTPFDLINPALALISSERPGDYNQALMDLGATICTPAAPKCSECPVSNHCRAHQDDAAEEYPRRPAPIPKREEDWCILLICVEGRLLVRRRPRGLLGGLYEFPALAGHPSPAEAAGMLEAQGFSGVRIAERLPDARHVFTHLIWHMQGYAVRCTAAPEGFLPVDRQALDALAFPSALKIYRQIADGLDWGTH